MIIFNIVLYSGTIVILISFIWAFLLRKNKEQFSHFAFFCIPLAEFLMSVNTIIGGLVEDGRKFMPVQNTFHLVNFFLLSFYFFKVLKKWNILLVLAFLAIIIIGFILSINNFARTVFPVYAILYLMIFIFCITYYNKLVNDGFIEDLKTSATFWIVTGLFLCSAAIFPFFSIIMFMKMQFGTSMAMYFVTVANLIIIIKHLFFMKGYACIMYNNMQKEIEKTGPAVINSGA